VERRLEGSSVEKLRDPWLVAAWPGMGLVGHLAAAYLTRSLSAEAIGEIPPGDHFDLAKVDVKNGILVPRQPPRTILHAWRGEDRAHDILILQSERQPESGAHRFCEQVMELAERHGVVRVFTFAAMAMPTSPEAPSRVFAAATDVALANELRALGVEFLQDGEIGGMNGLLIAAAAERGLAGACLLGEFPYFASGMPNPKASASILRLFSRISGIPIDVSELDGQAAEMQKQLMALVKQLEEVARAQAAAQRRGKRKEAQAEEEISEGWPAPPGEEALSPEDQARIEELFRAAASDRSKAILLKAELDRLDVFKKYENRFLDLFKRAE
jgi:proteasome assembly chaperone (PAC2) family protein